MCRAGGGEQQCSTPARHERPHFIAPDLLFFYDFYRWKVRAGAAMRDERNHDGYRLIQILWLNPGYQEKTDRALGPGALLAFRVRHSIWVSRLAGRATDRGDS